MLFLLFYYVFFYALILPSAIAYIPTYSLSLKYQVSHCHSPLLITPNPAAIRTARRGGVSVSPEDFEDSLRSFFSARGVPLAGMAEAAGMSFPSWLKGLGGQNSEALA